MRTIETGKAPAALGPYSQGTVAGNIIFTAGQIPVDPSTGKMPETVEAQARQAFANVKAILEAAGAASIANVNLFLKDMNDFAAVNAVYAEFFGKPYPARTCVEVSGLPKGALLEVAAVGIVGQ